MTSGTAKSPPQVPTGFPPSGARMHSDQIIDRQLTKTRRRVKLVDLGVAVMGLAGVVIGYVLVLVLLDHWVVELTTPARFLALAILVLGIGYYGVRLVVPLLLRRINPGYAAQCDRAEQSFPQEQPD